MKFCVINNTVTVIDGGYNSQEIMIQNAINAGFTESEVEIITNEEYETRLSNVPPVILPPTELELLQEEIAATKGALNFFIMNSF